MSNKKIANVFNDGAAVTIKATATKPNGDALPQAGQRGTIVSSPKPGRYMIDVAGFPLVNLPADELEPAAQAAPAKAAAPGAGHTPKSPGPAAQAYAFDVLPLAMIVASLTNPRTHFDPEMLQSMAESISLLGLLQPILVRPIPESRLQAIKLTWPAGQPLPTHEVVDGECRFKGCGIAVVRSVPVMIRQLTDEQVLRMQLVANVKRTDLHPLEEGAGYRRILDLPSQAEKSMAQRTEELAAEIKKSTRYIYQTLQLLKLCDFARQVFLEKKLDRGGALEIAKIGNDAGQIEATRQIAGLGAKGTEVVNNPMSQRAAADYVRDNHSLELKKAPFPIKVAIAGVQPCPECPKNSANARDLFAEGDKSSDVCLDRSCYGRKNTAHHQAIADAAKEAGQKVITGAAAKKIMPWEWRQDDLQGGYIALSTPQHGAGLGGKTIKQILGDDAPLPVLIENPHKAGFVKAYAEADVKRLFKERGIGATKDVGVSKHKADERAKLAKDRLESAWRQAWGAQLLEAAEKLDDGDLYDKLVPSLAARCYQRMDHENTKRINKLMGWTQRFGYDEGAKLLKFFAAMDLGELNKFTIAACIAGELHVASYGTPRQDHLDAMGSLLGVDGKAIKNKMQANAKAVEKAKADKAKAKAMPAVKNATNAAKPTTKRAPAKKPNMAFMASLHKSPALAAVTGDEPEPRTEMVAKLWTYIKKHNLQDKNEKRYINCDAALKALMGKDRVSMFEMAGLIGKHVKSTPYTDAAHDKKPAGKPVKKLTPADQQDLLAPAPSKILNPQSAWPFPIGAETPKQAQARSSKAVKGASA